MSDKDKCGALAVGGYCVLPAGHNMGNLDIPQNHRAAQTSPTASGLPLSAEQIDIFYRYGAGAMWSHDFGALCDQARLAITLREALVVAHENFGTLVHAFSDSRKDDMRALYKQTGEALAHSADAKGGA